MNQSATNPKRSKLKLVGLIVLVVLILDQCLKIWVKTNMEYGEQFSLFGTWGFIHFVENPGMAFGISLGGKTGKLLLSLFRIAAVGLLIYYIKQLIKTGQPKGVLVCFALILAGAIGNIIDSAFYGLIFSESAFHGGLAEAFPEAGGYASFLHGKVVDMLYFPMIDTTWPDWVPRLGGRRFQFFKPVFNIADSAISVGIITLLLFQRQFFNDEKQPEAATASDSTSQEEE